MNVRVGVIREPWEIALYVNNVTDERALLALDRERGTLAGVGYLTNQPRTFGISLRYSSVTWLREPQPMCSNLVGPRLGCRLSTRRLPRVRFSMSSVTSLLLLALTLPAAGCEQDHRAGADAPTDFGEGFWTPVFELPTHPEQMAVLPSGKVLMWPWAPERRDPPHGPVALWNSQNGSSTVYPSSGLESASGLAFQPDGVLLSAGGDMPNGGIDGNARSFVFDYRTESLRPIAPMRRGRVFPSATTLADGRILVSAGLDEDQEINAVPEVWDGASWTTLGNASNDDSQGPTFQFLAPDGRLFRAGPEPLSDWLDIINGVWVDLGVEARDEPRHQGTAVLYDEGRILLVGGCPVHRCEDAAPVATAQVIDLVAESPVWREVEAMSVPRHSFHATLLPDGTVLITGGTDQPGVFNRRADGILSAELWDPATEAFATVAPMTAPRHFQSAAVLLHDGRVLVAGGAFGSSPDDATFAATGQIYSPAYLNRGPRPLLDTAPSGVDHGESFIIETPHAVSVARVTAVRLSASSQGWNGAQRLLRLPFTVESGELRVRAPTEPSLAPPGFYLLFILTDDGVPSVGRPLRIGSSPT